MIDYMLTLISISMRAKKNTVEYLALAQLGKKMTTCFNGIIGGVGQTKLIQAKYPIV